MQPQQLFNDIDSRSKHDGRIVIAIDGMAASGKSTLAARLRERYPCNVIPMDYFFLRPEQRTAARLAAPGGNIDYERFNAEIVEPLKSGGIFSYRPYDCSTSTYGGSITVTPKLITVVEGVYSMHPEFSGAPYDIRVFMLLSEDVQRKRLQERCPALYKRFVNEWIPMENMYFEHFRIKEKCDYVLENTL